MFSVTMNISSLISAEIFLFFFQAEDGIRDGHVTGVQTCALPISIRLMSERRFRAAYDFLLLRALENPQLQELADWWTTIQEVEGDERRAMIRAAGGRKGGKKRRPRRRKRVSPSKPG